MTCCTTASHAHRTPSSTASISTLLKMYDLIFPVMMELSNTTDGNKTTYRDVLDGLDDAWPDGWKTTMSHMSYTTFRDEEYNNIGWQLVYFASMIFGYVPPLPLSLTVPVYVCHLSALPS